ncbi:hypothetical protein ACLOJK_002909 [Asimina triloba]
MPEISNFLISEPELQVSLWYAQSNAGTKNVIRQELQQKDNDLAFVAGSTGRVGSRTVRELIKLGFRVRVGVRSAQKAQTLVESVKQMKLDATGTYTVRVKHKLLLRTSDDRYYLVCSPAVEKLEIVECDLENDAIGPAIGNASVVICCIGASEKEVFDITGPYRIDYLATKKLIDAATAVKVKHFILVTSLGTNKIGFPAAILKKAEEALLASGLPYTIVRPGGMERPTDAYKLTHNLVLGNEDVYFGGQVSNLQVAELMAFMAKNRSLSFCKIVEVIAETTAPLTPLGDLLVKIPSQREDTSLVKELKEDPKPDPTPSQIEAASPSTMKEVPEVDKPKPRPSSPYVAYEDLKPPTSPTPTPSSTSGVKVSIPPTVGDGAAVSSKGPLARPSSPYVACIGEYEDLKPPTSPTPTPSSTSGIKTSISPNVDDGAAGSSKELLSPQEGLKAPNISNSVATEVILGHFNPNRGSGWELGCAIELNGILKKPARYAAATIISILISHHKIGGNTIDAL